MHFSLIVISAEEPTDEFLAEHLQRWNEANNDYDNEEGKWYWFQVGGRWTGHFTPGYDPEKDPDKQETCDLCHGTGKRPGVNSWGACNDCGGKGTTTTWATQWVPLDTDQIQVKQVLWGEVEPTFAVVKNGQWYDQGWEYDGTNNDNWAEDFKKFFDDLDPETWLTIVDYHS